ncbi:MAG: endonuclease NucS domain-containing protein [Pseudomonadota bacterium]
MKSFYRVMLGRQGAHVSECLAGNFIAFSDYENVFGDMTGKFPEEWQDFNRRYVPILIERIPTRTRISAGLTCGMLWTLSRGMALGDIVFCPDGQGAYLVGEISSEYTYVAGENLQHRRKVTWYPARVDRQSMSEALRNSTGATNTVTNITKYSEELIALIAGQRPVAIIATDPSVENASEFAMEMHLEDFLVHNWAQTDLGTDYEIYSENGELVGKQYDTEMGRLDILAIRKDRKELLVVELKKGRASDAVVGQILRYMGYVQEFLAEPEQTVRGVIIALDPDKRIMSALKVVPSVSFYRYKVSFSLQRA